ncbi:MAG TPA: GspMb/PilO family protein, partial [Stellaceae bacterium]|nr:GspMb/PilO family protein [Stellaceae bacterium]
MTLAERPAFGRVAALTILGSLVLLFFLGPFAAYCGLIADNRNALANRLALLERYQALAIRPASTAVSPETALLYPDVPESQTTALLQEAVKAAATAAHVEVQGLQVLRSDTASGATRIGVRVRAAGDITSLRDFL